jgi:O-antigen/teichoic acid export membrane protein
MSEAGAILPTSPSFVAGVRERLDYLLRAGLVVGNQGLNSAANLAISLYLIRMLGVAEFGIYAVYFATAFGISAVVNALIASPLVSIASQKAASVRAAMIVSASVAITAISLGLLLLALGLDLVLWLVAGSAHKSLLAVAFGTSMAASEFLRRACFLSGRADKVWRFDLLRYGLLLVVFTLLAWFNAEATTAQYVLLMTVSNGLAVAVLALPDLTGHASSWSYKRARVHIAHFARSGRWLSLSSMLQFAGDHALLLIAAFMVGPFAAGTIRICQAIVGVVNPILSALEHMLPKKLGEDIRQHGSEHALVAHRRVSMLIMLAMASILSIVALFAPFILDKVSGEELHGYEMLLRLYCALWLLYPIVQMLSFIFRARGRTVPVLVSQSIAAGLALATSIPLIGQFGAYGVVWGTMIAQVAAIVTLVVMSERKSPLLLRENGR